MDYRKMLYTGIIIIALGIVLTTTMKDATGFLGTVFIALGGLLFIISMSRKKQADIKKDKVKWLSLK